jgi:glucose/arabinose dehydrogenase
MRRRELLASLAVAGSTRLSMDRDRAQSGPFVGGPRVELEPVATGLEQPVALAFPSDSLALVADLPGQIYRMRDGALDDDPLLDIGERIAMEGETGLLGIAVHPNARDNGRLFVRYSRATESEDVAHEFVLSEFRLSGDAATVRPETERELLTLDQPHPFHNAGDIVFGPDGYLYVGVGDGGNSPYRQATPDGRPWYKIGNSQLLDNLFGSVLRIDVDTGDEGGPYAVPPDNPRVGKSGRDELYAWGFRNPWRMSFDRDRLVVADVGASAYEEVDVVVPGGNYGWPITEGSDCRGFMRTIPFTMDNTLQVFNPFYVADVLRFEGLGGRGCATPAPVVGELRQPAVQYPHTYGGESVGTAIIGGHVYRRSDVPGLTGKYVFADLQYGLRAAAIERDGPPADRIETVDASVAGDPYQKSVLSIETNDDGELFVTGAGRESGSGTIYRVTPSA